MKKEALFFVLLLVALLILGCVPKEPERAPEELAYVGTEGLVMSFMQNFPPSQIYDTMPLSLIVELKNKGTYDLSGERCWLHLSGFDRTIIVGLPEQEVCAEQLPPKSPYNPQGGYATREFKAHSITLPYGIERYSTPIVISACYEYKTIATPVVCVDPEFGKLGMGPRACTPGPVSLAGGQGAPVSIDSVDVEMMGRKALVRIYISNSGYGTVLAPGSARAATCPFNLGYEDYNMISYRIEMSGATLESCAPAIFGGPNLRLFNGRATLTCTFDVGSGPARKVPMVIELDYAYLDQIAKDIEIIKTPR